MPRRSVDWSQIEQNARSTLSREGPLPSRTLRETLGISPASLARLVKGLSNDLVTLGRGPSTSYAVRRLVADLPGEVPLYEILEDGSSRELGRLHLVQPGGYFVTSHSPDLPSGVERDLPFYLTDMRPTGFLGRLIPRQHQDLGLPEDLRVWSADTTIRYLTSQGWNLPGSLILGDRAFQLYLTHGTAPPDGVEQAAREAVYPRRAADLLHLGVPGSSAAGEQPKFLATVLPERRAVIVKFSPPLVDAVAERIADLLIAEHHALEILRGFGQQATRSELLFAGNQVFLEVERFDRTPDGGRFGLFSLLTLDSQYVGGLGTWSASVDALAKQGIVSKSAAEATAWLEAFSQLIANTDRHFGNLSFLARGARLTGLAPAYDVSPMLYAPVAHQLVERAFVPPEPALRLGAAYREVCEAATVFWGRLGADERLSRGFRAIARRNEDQLRAHEALAARLPTRSEEPR